MATIKSYTDLQQSKKLAEILPLESVDMWWSRCTITDFCDGVLKVSYAVEPCNISQFKNTDDDIPCWSLAALLGILPDCPDLSKHTDNKWYITTYPNGVHTCLMAFDNHVDACYEMILKLHELKML